MVVHAPFLVEPEVSIVEKIAPMPPVTAALELVATVAEISLASGYADSLRAILRHDIESAGTNPATGKPFASKRYGTYTAKISRSLVAFCRCHETPVSQCARALAGDDVRLIFHPDERVYVSKDRA